MRQVLYCAEIELDRRWPAAATNSRRRSWFRTARGDFFQPGIHQQHSIFSRVEPVAFDHRDAAFIIDRPLMPRFSSVGCDQQKRISWRSLQACAGNPSVLKIDKLNLVQAGKSNTGMRFKPRFAGIFGCEQDRKQRRGRRVQSSQ